MNKESIISMAKSGLIPENYAKQAKDARQSREDQIQHLLAQKKLPNDGWSERSIIELLNDFSMMDSNHFPSNCGVGERESRIYSDLVSRRHFGFGHGIGRSGDLAEIQPKAAGSSALNRLTNSLVTDLIRQLGVRSCQSAMVVPMATGMTMTLCLLSLRSLRPAGAKYVLWSRIDQKSCFKSIICAGFTPVIIELVKNGDEYQTNIDGMREKIEELGSDKIVAIMSTTSCFAPRAIDNLPQISKLCLSYGIPHLINNAYGIQSSKCMHLIEESGKLLGKDHFSVFVQSTDKNFMVPVGGAIIAAFHDKFIHLISKTYPGRASSTPSVDLFITLMSLGLNGYKKLCKQQKENFAILKSSLNELATKYGEKVLTTKNNPISIAMTLEHINDEIGNGKAISEIGSMLFTRGVSGTRVITTKDSKNIEGFKFQAWGSHSNDSELAYLTAASAIGMKQNDIELFIKRLDKVLSSKSTFVKK